MKTFSEDDIHRSVKLSVWSGVEHSNRRLDAVMRGTKPKETPAGGYSSHVVSYLLDSMYTYIW